MGIVVWLVILASVGASVYYVFFKRPELVEIATPANLRSTEELSKIKLSPEEIVSNPNFQVLKSYAVPLSVVGGGRANPFLAP